jgi:formylglycine-generating enzyme required for sulfatase activity
MKFVPVEIPGRLATAGRVLFSVWDTRVSDWETFIQKAGDTVQSGIYGYDSGLGGYDLSAMKWGLKPDLSWKRPGFPQTGQHPVVGVSCDDARRFCAWLSSKEGRTYRLPTSAEWSAAVGPQKYPWGDNFPPPKGAGNYGGSESRAVSVGISLFTIPGYNDGYPRTSPVGSFAPNHSGLYDMGGNVAQWCDEVYKVSLNSPQLIATYPFLKEESVNGIPNGVIRGGSWSEFAEAYMRSTFCMPCLPATRRSDCGFRCVLVEPAPAKPSFLDLVPSDLKFVPPLLNHPPTPTPAR